MMTSSNGIDWAYVVGAPSIALQDIFWSPELSLLVLVLLSEITASAIYTSSDAITWTPRTTATVKILQVDFPLINLIVLRGLPNRTYFRVLLIIDILSLHLTAYIEIIEDNLMVMLMGRI
jgi:hypothetical protein